MRPQEKATAYSSTVEGLLTLGDPREMTEQGPERWRDYTTLGLTAKHVPELVRMATDKGLHQRRDDDPAVWASLHAWRALGQLEAAEAVEPLLRILDWLAKRDDDWGLDDLPYVFGRIGPPAVEPTGLFVQNATHNLWARTAAGRGLVEIARRWPEQREPCIEHLCRTLEKAKWNDPVLNAAMADQLADLGATEAAELIRAAFATGRVDESYCGGYDEITERLGL